MFSATDFTNILRAIASALATPVNIILLLLMAMTIVLFGTLVAEGLTERLRLRVKLPNLVDQIRAQASPIEKIIDTSGLLKRQKRVLNELVSHPDLTPAMRESLAAQLLWKERAHYDHVVKLSDLVARLGPMFGLLGTLIPLGPGIIALGRGDTYTLSLSLLVAFDTTIAGLISAAAAFVISMIRKRWYGEYMAGLELVMECTLEQENAKETVHA